MDFLIRYVFVENVRHAADEETLWLASDGCGMKTAVHVQVHRARPLPVFINHAFIFFRRLGIPRQPRCEPFCITIIAAGEQWEQPTTGLMVMSAHSILVVMSFSLLVKGRPRIRTGRCIGDLTLGIEPLSHQGIVSNAQHVALLRGSPAPRLPYITV